MRIIDADKFLAYLIFSKHIDKLSCGEVKEAIEMCKIFPEDTTNGEIIQTLFPNIDRAFSNVIDLNLWWNAKYKTERDVEDKQHDKDIATAFQFGMALGFAKKCDEMCERRKEE